MDIRMNIWVQDGCRGWMKEGMDEWMQDRLWICILCVDVRYDLLNE